MSMEAIESVTRAEDEARALIQQAEERGRRQLAQAEEEGKSLLDDAAARAEADLAVLRQQTDEEATASARELSGDTENKKAVLRARAEKRMDQAVAMIVERIVNS